MFSHLVFTGGGLAGLSYIGVIRYMQEVGLHSYIHEVAGTSIGAFFACIFSMNIMAGEIEEYMKEYFAKEDTISFPVINSFMSFLDTYGLDNGSRLVEPIKHFVRKKYHWNKETISFREFAQKTGINLVICATNVNSRKCTYFCVDTTPDVCIYDAVQASMTLPFLMKPVVINNEMYVDGGLVDNTPYEGFRNLRINSLLVITTGSIVNRSLMPDNIMNYISILFQVLIENSNKTSTEMLTQKTNVYKCLMLENAPMPFLRIDATSEGTLQITITDDDIDACVSYGYTKMYEFVQEIKIKDE